MLLFKKHLSCSLKNVLDSINSSHGLNEESIMQMLEYPPDDKMGDIALPCFKLSKTLRMSPVMISEKIASELSDENIERIDATECVGVEALLVGS